MRLLKTLSFCLLPLFAVGQELNSALFTNRLLEMVDRTPEAYFDVSI
ncbi:MAG: hypothetical protein KDC44_02600 [Phaeodactylibacter sp.]|nr:hypothetical protein [Phaeodactylibacter sp.]